MRPHCVLALALLGAGTAMAADSVPIVINTLPSTEAPFKLSVTNARLVPEPGGKYSIGFQVGFTNTTTGSLVTAGGWSLDISKPDGTLVRRVKVTQGFDIAPGKTQTARQTLDSKSIGPVSPAYRFQLAPAAGATISYGNTCQGANQTCDGVEHYCQLQCNNPLVPQGGVASATCSCGWWWDYNDQCWRYVCHFYCECQGLPEPPYQDPYMPWW
jgi:hypothetical protein